MRLLILLLPVLLFGRFPQAVPQNSSAANKTAEIQGTVLDATSNEPIHKALVVLRTGEEPGVGTYTDDAGRFVLREVGPGTYLISAERNGFVADSKTQWRSVTVSAGDAAEPIILKLNRTGALSGRIVDADGDPVTGAIVQLKPLNAKKGRLGGVYANSDDRGSYRAYNIQPGKYKMSATYSSMREHDPRVKIQPEKDKIKEAAPTSYGTTYYPDTLDSGQATIIQVEPGADIHGIDIGLRHAKTVRVQGKVNSIDGELAAPLVLVVLGSMDGGESMNAQVRVDGSFEFPEVIPGRYSLGAIGVLQPGGQLAANQPLEVGETDIDGVQLTLGRPQTVTGKVIMPAERKVPAGLIVVLQSREKSGQQFAGDQPGGFAPVSDKSTFSLENVAAGDYDLVVGNIGKGDDLYVAGIRSGDQDILASGLHVGGSAVPSISLVLKANGAEIDCTVLDEKQKPILEAHVTLLPDPPLRSQKALRADCQTDASGKCTLLGIAPGDYHAFATAKDDAADFSHPAAMEGLEKFGQAVTVAQGDRKSMQLAVAQLDDQE